MNPRTRLHATLLSVCTAAASLAQAQDASSSLAVRSLASSCAQCHGTDGRPVADSIVPALAGLPGPVLIERMAAFKAGTRPATVMAQIARGYSEAQIRELAAYFALQSR